MNLALGIDTGGTYTDAVLVDHATGSVLAGAKALTTRRDLAVGIRGAIAAVFADSPWIAAAVTLVGLSTTLATNTLAEGQRGAVPLFLKTSFTSVAGTMSRAMRARRWTKRR